MHKRIDQIFPAVYAGPRPVVDVGVRIACILTAFVMLAGLSPVLAASAGPSDTQMVAVSLPRAVARSSTSGPTFQKAMKEFNRGDHLQAIKLWEVDAEAGGVQAQYVLGALYSGGDPAAAVAQDYAKAMYWYGKAAEQGHAEAQYNMGIYYAAGQGVAQDMTIAARWWQLAAMQGHAESQFNLGLLYAQGSGVTLDMAEAARWWDLAARQGNAAAQFNLGVMYIKGVGVGEDSGEAVRLWQLSARQGFGQAISILKTLQLSP